MNCCGRRDFLRLTVGTAAGAALSAKFGLPLAAQDAGGRAKRMVLLWMPGAPSQMDTFDPKPGADTGGPFGAIDTAADGVRISEHLPLLAKQMKRVSLIRTVNSRDPNHDTAQYLLHTSYRKAADAEHPHLSAVIATELGEAAPDLPAGVVLGGAPPAGAGYLAATAAPVVFDKISAPAEDVLASPGNPKDRFERRWKLLQSMERRFGESHDDRKVEERRRAYEKAHRVLTSERVNAFDVRKEPDGMRSWYGDTDFGNACLIARRLLEADVRFVEVMYGDWDTHNDNFNRVKQLCGEIDRPFSALLQDLDQRGLLKETLVVWMGEFGRTPRYNPNGGKDHWGHCFPVALAGGGIRAGAVVGRSDHQGAYPEEDRVEPESLHATIHHCLGIPPGAEVTDRLGRPQAACIGEPIRQVLL